MTNHVIRALYDGLVAADRAWSAAIAIAYPNEWPGDVRYILRGQGEPATPLREAYDKYREARRAFDAGGGWEALHAKDAAP